MGAFELTLAQNTSASSAQQRNETVLPKGSSPSEIAPPPAPKANLVAPVPVEKSAGSLPKNNNGDVKPSPGNSSAIDNENKPDTLGNASQTTGNASGASEQPIPPPQIDSPPPEVSGNANQDPNLNQGQVPPAADDPAFMESEILSYLEPYIYDVDGRRDPFQPYQVFKNSVIDENTGKAIETENTRAPLQRYNLSQLKLKAILWSVKTPRVIIQDPTSRMHTLITNDLIGNNGGYIAKIREGEVVVLEKVNVQGRLVSSTKLLRLKR